MMPKIRVVPLAMMLLFMSLAGSCSANTDSVELMNTATAADSTTTTDAKEATASEGRSTQIDWRAVEAIASGFMVARGDRDVTGAQTFLDERVSFDWGPNNGRDGLADSWAWENAFRLTHSLDGCEALRDGDLAVARCRMRVDSEVAETAGHEAGFVCIDATVNDGLISRVVAIDSADGCNYSYWGKAFQPLATWLAGAHPDITIDEMYGDRVSAEGSDLWRLYTDEYITDGQS